MARTEPDRLTTQESDFVDAIVRGGSAGAAGLAVGVSRTTGLRWSRRPEIQRAIEARRREAEDVATRAREALARRRAEAICELAEDVPAIVAELRRRAFDERGSAGVRACVELLRIAGLVGPESAVELAGQEEPEPEPEADADPAEVYAALVAKIRGRSK